MDDPSSNDLWEQVLLEEKRLAAYERGYTRVSDYEEDQSLYQVMEETSNAAAGTSHHIAQETVTDEKSAPDNGSELVEEEGYTDVPVGLLVGPSGLDLEHLASGSRWWTLSEELVDLVHEYLCDVDMLGYLRMVSKTPVFVPSDQTSKLLVKRIYPAQTGNLVADDAYLRFSSWRNLLIHRPRLRTNGLYSVSSK